ncbi:ankyrin repeat domain-containing protein [Vibrio coralliilyticus]|uniref:ankyrin repeat domain-containing protein n=1 Tax=Vibrio coralliilyticus TaxID=190893 RepID=UPI00148DB85A|nr:ankyrin repeat domain-containing protein [Vibrio coralliilyticus]NOI27743.1 ankyrin repeat domain-containing protein [Vibrio coralliilyticus]NOI47137.1 ankyrin repeat domain-containing protein [Vibrio coralliilyticus]
MRTPFSLAALLLSSPALSADCSDFFQSVSFGNIARLNASEYPQQCVNTLSSNGKTAVYIATENDDPAMIAWLVKRGADLKQRSRYDDINYTPFLMAGAKGKNKALVELLKYDIDFASTNHYGGTALIPAAEKGYLETVKILLEDGRTNINHVNDLGWTALMEVAVLGKDTENYQMIVKELLKHGADANIRDNQGESVLQHAESRGLTQIAEILKKSG